MQLDWVEFNNLEENVLDNTEIQDIVKEFETEDLSLYAYTDIDDERWYDINLENEEETVGRVCFDISNKTLLINSIIIEEEYQRRGLATRTMNLLIDKLHPTEIIGLARLGAVLFWNTFDAQLPTDDVGSLDDDYLIPFMIKLT